MQKPKYIYFVLLIERVDDAVSGLALSVIIASLDAAGFPLSQRERRVLALPLGELAEQREA